MIKKRKILPSDPDVTAYSDIAFLLIIFFILTTSFSMPFGRLVDMSECIFTISNVRFMELYRLWLENNTTCVHPCRLLQQVLVSV